MSIPSALVDGAIAVAVLRAVGGGAVGVLQLAPAGAADAEGTSVYGDGGDVWNHIDLSI